MRKPILALTAAAFAIGTSEFVIVGLLPQLSRSFRISIPAAGTLITVYALGVTFGSPLVAIGMGRVERKRALLWLLGIFVLGNVLCALAPTFPLLLTARILTSLCHGAFFGIGSVMAAQLVPRSERAQAIALMFTGLTLANILGVPAGTALSLATGWRSAFWGLVPIGVIAALLLVWMVPQQQAMPVPLRHELRQVLRLPVQLVLLTSTLSSTAMFCVLTYISPMLATVTHLAPATIAWVLLLFGVGITLGNLAGAWFSDRRQLLTLVVGYALLVVVLLLFLPALPHRWPAIAVVALWGAVHFGAGAPLQPRIVDQAHGANLASTLNQSAFNLGNALGASLGGILLTRGVAYRELPAWAAAVAVLTMLAAVSATVVDRRSRHAAAAATAAA